MNTNNIVAHNRQKGANWYEKASTSEVIIGGAGGIGSWLALFLSRMGVGIHQYDFDLIEEHNYTGQCFPTSSVGSYKTSGVESVLKTLCGANQRYQGYTEKYDSKSTYHRFMFSGFDNMSARKDMFEVFSNGCIGDSSAIFIDGRLAFDSFEIYCVTKDNLNEYSKYLWTDAEANEEPDCTAKQTSFMASLIASFMCGYFSNHLSNLTFGEKIFDVPFYFSYHLPSNRGGIQPPSTD